MTKIQFIADNIDQLDLALDQLIQGDRNFDRFALMLIDNVIELTLHEFIQDKARWDGILTSYKASEYDKKAIEEGLGRNFDNKVKTARKIGIIHNIDHEAIINIHSYRNSAYHKGLRHEKILHSLAIFYFRNACSLLMGYEPKSLRYSGTDKISYRAMKYLGNLNPLNDDKAIFHTAYSRLDHIASLIPENLIGDLSEDISETIDSTNEIIDFLEKNNPERKNRNEVIIDAQIWGFAFTEKVKRFATKNKCKAETIQEYIDWIRHSYSLPITSDPILSWRKRHQALIQETDYNQAIKKYCNFLRQTEEIRAQLQRSAGSLSGFIEEQMEIARENKSGMRNHTGL